MRITPKIGKGMTISTILSRINITRIFVLARIPYISFPISALSSLHATLENMNLLPARPCPSGIKRLKKEFRHIHNAGAGPAGQSAIKLIDSPGLHRCQVAPSHIVFVNAAEYSCPSRKGKSFGGPRISTAGRVSWDRPLLYPW